MAKSQIAILACLFVGIWVAVALSIHFAVDRDSRELKTYTAAKNALPIVRGKVFWTAQAKGDDPHVYLYVDGKKVLEGERMGDSQTYAIVWDTHSVPNGDHMLTMRSFVHGTKVGEESHAATVRN